MHPHAKDFLEKLLVRDPKKRLGAVRGISELKEHPFLADVNWQTLISDPAPWVPLGKEADVQNFPNAREDDLHKILEEETKEDFSAVKQASMTMRFNQRPLLDVRKSGMQTVNLESQEIDKMVAIQGGSFNNFEGVNNRALEAINLKEADKEMHRVNRLLKKMK